MRNLLNRLRLRQEPLVYLGVVVGAAYILLQVSTGVPLDAALVDSAVELVLGALAVLTGRNIVTAPASLDGGVDHLSEADLDQLEREEESDESEDEVQA